MIKNLKKCSDDEVGILPILAANEKALTVLFESNMNIESAFLHFGDILRLTL
jgi:hypothetical protein